MNRAQRELGTRVIGNEDTAAHCTVGLTPERSLLSPSRSLRDLSDRMTCPTVTGLRLQGTQLLLKGARYLVVVHHPITISLRSRLT